MHRNDATYLLYFLFKFSIWYWHYYHNYKGAFPPDYNQLGQNTTSAVINIFGQLNNHNISVDKQGKNSKSSKQLQSDLVFPCNCSTTVKQSCDEKQENCNNLQLTHSDEKATYFQKKTYNKRIEKKHQKESIINFNNSIQTHSSNFQEQYVSLSMITRLYTFLSYLKH